MYLSTNSTITICVYIHSMKTGMQFFKSSSKTALAMGSFVYLIFITVWLLSITSLKGSKAKLLGVLKTVFFISLISFAWPLKKPNSLQIASNSDFVWFCVG